VITSLGVKLAIVPALPLAVSVAPVTFQLA